MDSISQQVTVLAIIAFVYYSYSRFKSKNQAGVESSTFPGPPADLIIGHARVIPLEYAWKTFAEWKNTFGDIIHVHVFGKPIIILNSIDAVKELLEKRNANYSDRPQFILFQELMGWGYALPFTRYGDRFKKGRKLAQRHFDAQSSLAYRPTQRTETHALLLYLLETPDQFKKHVGRAISANILMTAYGQTIMSENDPYIRTVETAMRMLVESSSSGMSLVDFFPVLKYIPAWFPGAGFKRHAIKANQFHESMVNDPFEIVQKERARGVANPSVLKKALDEYEDSNTIDLEYEKVLKNVVGDIYGAGFETTNIMVLTFILVMTLNPSVAKKAQAEIDMVVVDDRLPDFDDRERLPYIDCILREIYRWHPPTPLGVPHCSMEQDIYLGKIIPKNAMIIPNIWGILNDPKNYPHPEKFDPDRFINMNNRSYNDIADTENERLDPGLIVFGFGRRICPGRFYADAKVWLIMACVLTCFNILPPLDENGEELMPVAEFTSGTTSQVKPFKCRIVLRHSKYEKIIQLVQKSN